MTACTYCGRKGGPEHPNMHVECHEEYCERERTGMCVKCGEETAVNPPMCGSCTYDSPWRGY